MRLPAFKFESILPADGPAAPADADFHALVPIAEPLSAGEVPIRPDLATSVQLALPHRVARSRAGYRSQSPSDTAPRPRLTLVWGNRSRSDVDQLREFFLETCRDGELAFSVRLDGPDGNPIVLRAIENSFSTTLAHRNVYSRVTVDAEYVWSQE